MRKVTTLKAFSGKKKDTQKTEEEKAKHPEQTNIPLQEAELFTCWYEIINRLPQQEKALAMRMRDMKPSVEGTNKAVVTVFNNQVANEMARMLPEMESYLRQRMHNSEARIEIRVAEAEKLQRVFSKPERLRSMLAENHALSKLVKDLDMKLD